MPYFHIKLVVKIRLDFFSFSLLAFRLICLYLAPPQYLGLANSWDMVSGKSD